MVFISDSGIGLSSACSSLGLSCILLGFLGCRFGFFFFLAPLALLFYFCALFVRHCGGDGTETGVGHLLQLSAGIPL